MKKQMIYALSLLFLFSCEKEVSYEAPNHPDPLVEMDLTDKLGVTNWGAKYHHTNDPILIEGAKQVQAMGSSLIKLAVTRNYRNEYNYNSPDWPVVTNIKELLMTDYFQTVLDMPFTVYSLIANEFSAVNWKDGLGAIEYDMVENEYYEAAKYLIETFAQSEKTFVLQNWEGDNLLNLRSIANDADRAVAIQGMIDYLNARQDGITRARTELGDRGVTVAGAAEVNWVPGHPSESFVAPLVIDEVIPHTRMDLYSFSSWGTTTAATADWLGNKIQYIKDKAPSSDLYGTDNVFLGEFGCYEVHIQNGIFDDYSGEYQRVIAKKQLISAFDAGAKWAFYWQMYCNGLRNGVPNVVGRVYTNSDLVGVWLIRADGTETPTYTYFKDLLTR